MSSDLKIATSKKNAEPILEEGQQEMEIKTKGSPSNEPKHKPEIEEQYLGGEFSSDIMKKMRKDPTAIGKLFKEGKYPYTDRIARRAYEREKKETAN